jgi:pantoate--beta-alanine ligase
MTKTALVPTMGALHEGHLALVHRARELADRVVVSIFVNPTQFGTGEDFDGYPRTLDADRVLLGDLADVFAPTVDEVYPPDNPPSVIQAGPMGDVWEGAARPGHFDGVLTVVNRLFDLVKPDIAVFGEKDWQQLTLIRRMVADRGLPIEIVGVPTVRELNGLALSSRNRFLSPDELEKAALLPTLLRQIAESGGTAESIVRAAARLDDAGFVVDYLDVVDESTLEPTTDLSNARVIVAARIGTTRLIDNMPVAPAPER